MRLLVTTGIVAFGFGSPSTISANQKIAKIALKESLKHKASIYTQVDILIDPSDISTNPGVSITYIPEKPGNPPTTLRIARGAIEWARKNNLTTLLVIAAKPHLKRIRRDMEVAIIEVRENISLIVCEEINKYSEMSWFCPDSQKKQTRSSKDWRKREKFLNFLPFWFYKIIAK